MFRELWRKKVLIVFIAALLILFPAASVRPAQALSKVVFLSVGVEHGVDGYTVTGAVMVNRFTNTGEGETRVVSADGTTIEAAFDKITADQGREVSLAHCNLVVFGASLGTENVAEVLKFFVMQPEISNNALLVWTDADVGKLLETSATERTDTAGGLVETIVARNQHVHSMPLTLERFYKNYLKGREGFMSVITLENGEIRNTRQLAVFTGGVFKEISYHQDVRG